MTRRRGAGTGDKVPSSAVLVRLLAAFAFAAMIAGGIEPFYLRALFLDAPRWRAALTELPYRKLPGLRRFLLGVDARTPPGARIAIWIPQPGWDGAYGYGYYRAPFFLTGKQVVPLQVPFIDRLVEAMREPET